MRQLLLQHGRRADEVLRRRARPRPGSTRPAGSTTTSPRSTPRSGRPRTASASTPASRRACCTGWCCAPAWTPWRSARSCCASSPAPSPTSPRSGRTNPSSPPISPGPGGPLPPHRRRRRKLRRPGHQPGQRQRRGGRVPAVRRAGPAAHQPRRGRAPAAPTRVQRHPRQWQLQGALLAEIDRILAELDMEQRSRRLMEELDRSTREKRERFPALRRLRRRVRGDRSGQLST